MGTRQADQLIARRSAHNDGEWAEASSAENCARAERIVEVAASILAAEGELVGLLSEFHEAKGWKSSGYRSLEHWLVVNAGYTTAEARIRAALSDRSGDLPHLMGALRSGSLSVGAARNASKVATSVLDEQVTEIATRTTASQAARVFRGFEMVEEAERRRRPVPVDADSADTGGGEEPEDHRGPLTWWRHWWDEHGYLNVDGRLDPTGGAELEGALEAMAAVLDADRNRDSGAHDGHADGPLLGWKPVSRVDALGELAATTLALLRRGGRLDRGGERFTVHVTVDAAVLAGTAAGSGVFDSGRRVDADVVRSWLGEARIDLLVHDHGRPLWLGRERRVANRALRRALAQRDQGCAFPGCDHHRFVDAHHVLAWEAGGGTDIDNMVLLCRRHHRLLHVGEYRISMIAGRPVFHRRDGTAIGRDGPSGEASSPPSPPPRPPEPQRARRSGERLTAWGADMFVGALFGALRAA